MSEDYSRDIAAAIATGLKLDALDAHVRPQLARIAADRRVREARRLIFAASGDSLFASMSALPALRRWSGLPAQAMTSLEFSRYEIPLVGAGDVLVAVSNSGNSTRTRETVLLARERGLTTLGITGTRAGTLASLAALVIDRPVTPPEAGAFHKRAMLHIADYVAAMWTIYALGIELGLARSMLDQADAAARHRDLADAVAMIGAAAIAIEPAIAQIAAEAATDSIWFLGAGPNGGAAHYGAAELQEEVPVNGIAQDLEEWAHLQYFLTLHWGARALVFVLAPPGNALDRAEEMVQGIAGAGGRAVVVGAAGQGRFDRAWRRLDLPAVHELLSPLLTFLPGHILALHLARAAGHPETPLRRRDDYWLIRKGLVRESASGLG
jgi:glucosamine--fructose-6-phosphate aminotransferase (isomerizing)